MPTKFFARSKGFRQTFLLFTLFLIFAANVYAEEIKIEEGKESGISIAETKNANLADTKSVFAGPASIRLLTERALIVDSMAGRLVVAGRFVKRHVVPVKKLPAQAQLGDLAFTSKGHEMSLTNLWVVNNKANSIYKLSLRGEIVLTIGPAVSKEINFTNLKYIETDHEGNLYTGDADLKKIFKIALDGKILAEYPWDKTAFCLAGGGLFSVAFANNGWTLEKTDVSTGRKSLKPLTGLDRNAFPHLWGFSAGKVVFTAWAGGPQGQFVGLIDPETGKHEVLCSLGEMPAMTRFLSVDAEGNIWRAVEDFAGTKKFLRIIKLKLDGEAEG